MLRPDETEACRNAIELMDKYLKKQITWDEYELENAYQLLLYITNLKPVYEPERPQEMFGWDTLPEEKKKKISDDPTIKNYFSAVSRAHSETNANLYHLHELQRIIPKGDTTSHEKINRQLNLFERTSTSPYNAYLERSFTNER
jgi:hypothetical protein